MKLSTTSHTLTLGPPPVVGAPSAEDMKPVTRLSRAVIFVMVAGIPFTILLMIFLQSVMNNIFGMAIGFGAAVAFSVFCGHMITKCAQMEALIQQEFEKSNSDKIEEWQMKVLIPYLSKKYGVENIEIHENESPGIHNSMMCSAQKNGQNTLLLLTGVSIKKKRGRVYSSASVDYSKLGMLRMTTLEEE